MYQTILGVHDGCLTVFFGLLQHICSSFVSYLQHLVAMRARLDQFLYLCITFQQFDGQETGGVFISDTLILLHFNLHLIYGLLEIFPMIKVNVTKCVLAWLGHTFVGVDYGLQQLFHSPTRLEHRGHQWNAKETAQYVAIEFVATRLKLVKHIQRTHYLQVHIHQLRREVQVAFDVAGIHYIDDDIRSVFNELLAHIEFFRTICRERVGARQVNKIETIATVFSMSLLGIYRDTRIIAHTLMGT